MSTLSQSTAARLLGAALLVAPWAAARAQVCDTVSSRTSLAALSGRPIAAVHVVTADPDPLPGPAAHLGVLHVRTRPSTVRRELLVAAGDTVDTLRVARWPWARASRAVHRAPRQEPSARTGCDELRGARPEEVRPRAGVRPQDVPHNLTAT